MGISLKGRNFLTLMDFTPEEIEATLRCGFEMVSLGPIRLRTETAAVAGCHAVNLKQSL